MFKFLSILVFFASFQAFANDGATAIVEVLGISPGPGITKKVETKFYGGQAEAFANVMPVSDVSGGRSATFVSDLWIASLYCYKNYERPTNGETRSDWMCELQLLPKKGSWLDQQDGGDKFWPNSGDFNVFAGHSENVVLGVVPPPKSGHLFSFYGGNAGHFAAKMPAAVSFQSKAHQVTIACQQGYQRPTTGQWRNDYMCSVYAQPR